MGNARDPFWMVYGEGQRGSAYQHRNVEAAIHEARRLAREHPNITFYVMAPKRGYRVADPIQEIEIDDGIPF